MMIFTSLGLKLDLFSLAPHPLLKFTAHSLLLVFLPHSLFTQDLAVSSQRYATVRKTFLTYQALIPTLYLNALASGVSANL